MKLWQKIFLYTLILVMLAVSVTSILLLRSSFQMAMNQKKESAIAEHEFLIANCKNMLLTQRLRQNVILLEPKVVQKTIRELFSDENVKTVVCFYDEDKTLIYSNRYDIKLGKVNQTKLLEKTDDTKMSYMELLDTDLSIASKVKIEANTYYIVTVTDVKDVSMTHENMLTNIRTISMVCAVIIAVVLLFVVKLLLHPLQKINNGTRAIAIGDYRKRFDEQGNDELSNLAHNMNIMAESVEKNVHAIEQIAEERRQFIANLSHEMKTPLTSILGFSDLLCIDGNISTKQRLEYASIIKEEARRMRTLSGKLMELITVGKTDVLWEKVDTEKLFLEINASLEVVAKSRGMNIVCKSEPGFLKMDKELFKSLLYNLADNGMKASKEGDTIKISGWFENDDFIFTVTDEGVGIEQEEISKIVQAFYMVDKTRGRKNGGAGLGLALCMEIVNLHNGKMLFDSEPQSGTKVTVKMCGGEAVEKQ